MMTYFCNILTLFTERFIETVLATKQASAADEFRDLFVHKGLLRWVMREYGRILMALCDSGGIDSRPSSSNHLPSKERPRSAQDSERGQGLAKARFMSLQPVLVNHCSYNGLLPKLLPYAFVSMPPGIIYYPAASPTLGW